MRRTEWLGRLVLIPLGLLIAVLTLEVLLQLAAQVVRATGSHPSAWESRGTDNLRILCLGDSNTYGVWLADRERDAWPPQLEALWNESEPPRPVEVLNAAYPGTNSSRLLRNFAPLLEAFEPDLAIVMVGFNDSWTEPAPVDSRESDVVAFIQRHSRVLRLARLLRPRIDATRLEVIEPPGGNNLDRGGDVLRFGEHEFDVRWQKRSSGPMWDHDALVANLGEMAAQARLRGVPLVMTTYPSSHLGYGRANIAIRAAARESGTVLVDLAAVFRPLCPRKECPGWLYQDQHPVARGYRLVAETIFSQLRESTR